MPCAAEGHSRRTRIQQGRELCLVGAFLAAGVQGAAAAAGGAKRRRTSCVARQPSITVQSGTSTEQEAADEANPKSDWGERFEWNKAWYPMAVVADLFHDRPNKLELLGEKLVAWKDGEGAWHVFEDRCPHRNAPLSDGRVEDDGTLLCSYHGWRFDGEGKLAALPQAKPDAFPRLQANPRSCAAARPTQVLEGLLWVWGECSKDARLESALVEPTLPEKLADPEIKKRTIAFNYAHRDLPYGCEVAMENAADPAHLEVAHHGLGGNRYTDPVPYLFEWERRPTNKGGFKVIQDKYIEGSNPQYKLELQATQDFRPPCQMHVQQRSLTADSAITLAVWIVPTRPGRARIVSAQLVTKGTNGEDAPSSAINFGLEKLPIPRWLLHVLASFFAKQDLVILHDQQLNLQMEQKKSNKTWRESYWLPTSQDAMVVTFRRWLDKNGGVGWSHGTPTELADVSDKRLLFNTYHSHTAVCASCRGALQNVATAKGVLEYSALVASTSAVACGSWPLLVGGAALGLSAVACGKLENLFYENTFDHQDNK